MVGEVCLGGEGLARGYLNRPELTAEKFIENPYQPGTKIYKTGDLAKWLSDGSLEFIGRKDHQVKIRGFRIEIGEIESRLETHPAIKDVVVVEKIDNESNYLCAYFVADLEITQEELRNYLLKMLPEYMIPSYFVKITTMPLTVSGKLDLKSLPEPKVNLQRSKKYIAPLTEIEKRLAKIWSEVLNVEKVGIEDNFFELGGHSLKASSLVFEIYKEMEIELPLRKVFETPTIKGLALYIKEAKSGLNVVIEKIADHVNQSGYYPVSSAQKRMFILNQFNENSTSYNLPGFYMIEGDLNRDKIAMVFQKLVKRHEAFRTSFEIIEGEVMQKIVTDLDFRTDWIKATHEEINEIIRQFVQPFDLSQAPLLRVKIIELSHKYLFMFDMQHIISDGISMQILINEFIDLYNDKELPELRIQYKDFAVWQNELINSGQLQKQEEYWLNKFNRGDVNYEIPILDLPTDLKRPKVMAFEGESFDFQLSHKLTLKIKELMAKTDSTLYMLLLAAYNVLLCRYSGQEDIIVGSPIAGRSHVDLEKVIGMFVNTLIMKNQPVGTKSFINFLKEVKENSLEAYENQDYQFEMLVDKLDLQKDLSRNPIFDTVFALQNKKNGERVLEDLRFIPYQHSNQTVKFDLSLYAYEGSEKLYFNMQYRTSLFMRSTIERMAEHYINILKCIVENPEVLLEEIEMVPEEEKQKLLVSFNNTETLYPIKKTIAQLFADEVQKRLNGIALIFNDQKMTYQELDVKSDQLAGYLQSKGVGPGQPLALMLERSFEMIIGILAILKTGGAYLPIDPAYPESRITYILNDSNAKLILTQPEFVGKVQSNIEVIDLTDENIYIRNHQIKSSCTSSDLAYIIYTSGTTGRPKGNLVTHYNVTRVVKETNYIQITDTDRILQLSNYAFDGSVFDIFGALLNGATLVLIDKDTILDPRKIASFIKEYEITLFFVTTALFNNLVENNIKALKDVRKVLFGGEKVSVSHVEKALNYLGKGRLIHVYGPTESTVFTTYYPIDTIDLRRETIPIGRPIANTEVFICSENSHLQPIGVVGELCISGNGLVRGYLNQPDLMAEKFVQNPYKEARMYKTGDLARMLDDGNIEFIGRKDQQVKIRGFRIELGEIEAQMLKHKLIKEAVVIDKIDTDGNKYLCAYMVIDDSSSVEIRTYLKKELPDYMIPSYFITLEKMPLNPNGKIDHKALPEPKEGFNTDREYVSPVNETEEILAEIWSEVLGVEKISTLDNFFELGGHSLKATTFVARVYKELKVELPLREVFKIPTIKELAQYIDQTEKTTYLGITKVKDCDFYPLTSAQKRMFALNQLDENSITYNIPGVMFIEGDLDINRLKDTFIILVNRHESLRTSFAIEEGTTVQKIHPEVDLDFSYVDADEAKVEELIKQFIRPFDLYKAPLFRVKLVKVSGRYLLMNDLHHIIADGVSLTILTDELIRLYNGQKLSDISIQYKDFAVWQEEFLKSDKMVREEEYWLEVFAGEIPLLNLPYDYPRPVVMGYVGDRLNFTIDRNLSDQLNQLASKSGTTLFMVLLAAYNLLLARYSGQEDIIIGTPIAGRPHADLEKIIGMFVNTLALRNQLNLTKSFTQFLAEVKENTLRAYENQDYQFEMLIEKLNLKRDLSRNPLFDTMFSLENIGKMNKESELTDLKFIPYQFENKTSKFDLSLSATETYRGIALNLEYSTELFKHSTIERLAQHFSNLLQSIVRNPDLPIFEFEMLVVEEKEELIYHLNETHLEYPSDKTIQQLFEEQVAKTPDEIAVICQDSKVTYDELNTKANQLAIILRQMGVESDHIVGIMVERSLEMLIGIFGILKAGAAYLPLDPKNPKNRIEYMLKDSGTKILLTQLKLQDTVEIAGEKIDLTNKALYHPNDLNNLEVVNRPDNLAYIIYTSGSTGNPKGVMVEHRNVVAYIHAFLNEFKLTSADTVLQQAFYGFDVSVEEIYPILTVGGKLVIPTEDELMDLDLLTRIIDKYSVSIMSCSPLVFNELNKRPQLSSVQTFISGGDVLKVEYINNLLINANVYNLYGPTETTVSATYYQCTGKETTTVPIGKPFSNYEVYILDKTGSPFSLRGSRRVMHFWCRCEQRIS